MVDEFAAVVGMKTANPERKLFQDRFQDRQQPRFPNLRRAPHHLPLRHFVNSIDVVHPFGSVQVSLMHRVHTQVAGLALRIRSTWRHRTLPISTATATSPVVLTGSS